MKKNDAINPEHYNRLSPEPKDVIRSWDLNFNLGNAIKYIARAGHKGDTVEDLRKAQTYIQFEIDAVNERGVNQCSNCDEDINLCDSCTHVFPVCPARNDDITFGNGKGKDNIIECSEYEKDDEKDEPHLEDELEFFRKVIEDSFVSAVKPVVLKLKVPEAVDMEEVIKRIKNTPITPVFREDEPTEYQKKAMRLYNAYLYKLDKISKEIGNKKCAGCVFSPTVVLKGGFDPEEVLDDLTNKIMAE